MSPIFHDTIFALSSGALPSGVAVIRLSGPHVCAGLVQLVGDVPPARVASLRIITDAEGCRLDSGLVLFFEGSRSFTGEDSAELQVHGGRAVVLAILGVLGRIPGFRHAEAGDFTRRAFLNGKIDLTGAEALADLISAETESQRRLALQNAEGGQRALYDGWGRRLLHARAMIEAELDFADESDVPGSVSMQVWQDMKALSADIANHVEGYRAAEIIRDGLRVVLIGAPNAGKSSLLNMLARRDVAIVTHVPGTTRDLVEVALDLDGVKVLVTDTAGIRETDDIVEKIGVERALTAAGRSDLVLELSDLTQPMESLAAGIQDRVVWTVGTKLDLPGACDTGFDHFVSAMSGAGIGDLVGAISGFARSQIGASDSQIIPSRVRHLNLLGEGLAHLNRAIESDALDLELRAEELRLAARSLERMTGSTNVEDLLGVIFSEFCIGK